MQDIDRLASRLLVLAPTGRVLLLHIEPPRREPIWATPGGGLDEGETYEEAALRELYEEVGRGDLPLARCVLEHDVVFTWDDWRVHQHERLFLVVAPEEFEAVMLHPDEEPIIGTAWCSAEEVRALTGDVYPEGLADLIDELTGGDDGERTGEAVVRGPS